MIRLAEFFKVRPGEGRAVALLASLMVSAAAGMGMGGSGIDALFFARFGVSALPTLYVVQGVFTIVTLVVISALLSRLDQRALYVSVPLLLALILVAERLVLLLDLRVFYPVMWLIKGLMISFQGLSVWGLAGAICDTRQAKRLFPLFSAGSILGTVLGSSLTPLVVGVLHSENLILVWAATLGVSYLLGRALLGRMPPSAKRASRQQQPGIVAEMRAGFDFVRQTPLLMLIAVSAFLFSIAWFSLEFPFNSAATAAFPDTDALAGFLGIFMGIITGVALLMSLFLANRLFARFGIMPMILVFPAIYALAFAVLGIVAPFPLIAAFRFAQIAWVSGVAGTAWQAMFNVIPRQRREQSRAFMSIPEQGGTMTAGILLIIAQRLLQPQQVFWIGLAAAVPILIVLWRAMSAYRAALVDALRAGQPQVFYDEEEPFGGFARDAAAVRALVEGVDHPDPVVRRVSIEVLGNLSVPQAVQPLLGALSDPDAAVRVAALRALARAGDRASLVKVTACLQDPEADVRLAAVGALGNMADRPAEVNTRLKSLLADPSPSVRARAALLFVSSDPAARAVLLEMTFHADPHTRASAVAALGEWSQPDGFDSIARALHDPAPSVRRAAASGLAQPDAPRVVEALVAALADDDRSVRESVADSLGQHGESALPQALAALSDPALEVGALMALERLPAPQTFDLLRAYARERTTDAMHYYRLWQEIAPISEGDRVALLAESLLDKARQYAIHALRAVGLTGDRAGMALAIDNLRSASAEQRSNALEALDALAASSEIVRPLLQIFDTSEPEAADATDALLRVMQERDSWLRACGALVAADSGHWEIRAALQELASSDSDMLVKETARYSLKAPIEARRRPQLSVMEQILFLRRVALFSSLAPTELKTIAAITGQQSHPRGALICKQGQPGDELFVITSGEVKVVVSSGGQPAVEVARRGAGDIIGEMSILSREPRMASIVALGTVRTLAIQRQDFEALLRERPRISLAVMNVLCAKLRERSEK